MADISMNEAFGELISLAGRSVGCRALLRSFLDDPCELGMVKIDRIATDRTEQNVYCEQPSDGILDALTAARALYENDSGIGASGHDLSPQTAR